MENYTFIGFLITCVLGLSGFATWLVKKVINITNENVQAFKDFKFAIHELKVSVDHNTDATKELKQTILTLNHK